MFPPDLIRLLVFKHVAPQCIQTALNCSMLNVKWRRVLEADKLEFMQRVISNNRWHAFWQRFFQCAQCNAVVKHKNALRHEKRHRRKPTSDVFDYQVCRLCVKVYVGRYHLCDLHVILSCSEKQGAHLQLHCDRVCKKKRDERYKHFCMDLEARERRKKYFWYGLGWVGGVCAAALMANFFAK